MLSAGVGVVVGGGGGSMLTYIGSGVGDLASARDTAGWSINAPMAIVPNMQPRAVPIAAAKIICRKIWLLNATSEDYSTRALN